MIKKLKLASILFFTTLLTACACSSCAPAPDPDHFISPTEKMFFSNLQELCGQQFVGQSAYPDDPNHDFAGKKLVATFDSCDDREIRIPFVVGEDHSRTWIITKTRQGLLLKHDHRHEDGTPDEVTMYGGFAGDYGDQSGTQFKQYFLADEHTAELIPDAKSNAWMLEFKPETKELVYYLERHQQPRYKAILKANH